MLETGTKAPEFVGVDENGNEVSQIGRAHV